MKSGFTDLLLLEATRQVVERHSADEPGMYTPDVVPDPAYLIQTAHKLQRAIENGDNAAAFRYATNYMANMLRGIAAMVGEDFTGVCPCCGADLLPFKLEQSNGHAHATPLPTFEGAAVLAINGVEAIAATADKNMHLALEISVVKNAGGKRRPARRMAHLN